MITERELCEAIEECLTEPITGTKRSILADLIIIQEHLFGEPPREFEPMIMASYAEPPVEQAETIIVTDGGSEFLRAVDGRKSQKVWKLLDELMEAVKILHPRMYEGVLLKIANL